MKRITVKLPDDVDAQLGHEAAGRGMTTSELIREAIESHLGADRRRRRTLLAAGAGRSGQPDVSERIGEIFAAQVER